MGVWSITTPNGASAFSTADIITEGTGTVPPSPMPLTPIGFLVQKNRFVNFLHLVLENIFYLSKELPIIQKAQPHFH